MIADHRNTFKIGSSRAVTIPKRCRIGTAVTMAGDDRLILVDTKGQIHEDDLLKFFIECVQPMFLDWWRMQRNASVLDNYVKLGRKIVNGR